MIRIRIFTACLLSGLSAAALQAQVEWPEPNWTVRAARDAAAPVDHAARLGRLFEQARAGRDSETLASLQEVAADRQLTLPARERILQEFAQGLGDLPPGSAGPAVLQYLLTYPARTLVPHPDRDRVGTPLYNIRAATAGSVNEWRRQEGYDAGIRRFGQDADGAAAAFIADYRAAAPARRRGLLQALPAATGPELQNLASQALGARSVEPELAPVAAHAALLLGDGELLQAALVPGGGPETANLLEQAAATLDETQRADLLDGLLDRAGPVNASLAIAQLAPGLLHRGDVADRLFGLMEDPTLGPSAALALAASGRAELAERLSGLAAEGRGPSSLRAAMALAAARDAR